MRYSPATGPEAPKPIVARRGPVRAAGVKIRTPLATSNALCPGWTVIHLRTTAGTSRTLNRSARLCEMTLRARWTATRLILSITGSLDATRSRKWHAGCSILWRSFALAFALDLSVSSDAHLNARVSLVVVCPPHNAIALSL